MIEELSYALKVQREAAQEASEAEVTYTEALREFEQQHAEVVERYRATRAKAKLMADRVDALKKVARDWFKHRDDKDLPDGVGLRREKEVVIHDYDELLRQCLQHAPFLLSIDEKALRKFVVNNSIDDESGGYDLPPYIRRFLTALDVACVPLVTISDTKVVKAAPDEAPEERRYWFSTHDFNVKEMTLDEAIAEGYRGGPFLTSGDALLDGIPF